MEHMRCNRCGHELEPKSQCIAALCCHMFCTKCAQNMLERDEPCPICDGIISRSNVRLVTIMHSSSSCQLSLCGQTPETVLEAALLAIKFYCEQQRLSTKYEQVQFNKKYSKMQEQCKTKLGELHNGFQQAKRRYQDAVQQKNALEQDNQELQQKYTQKAMQARKLQDMFKVLQQENEELKRRLGGRGGSSTAGLHAGQLSGSGSGRGGQPSPFGTGGPQMITTIHQHKSVIELSPTPGAGGFLGHGSATVPQQRPGTAGGGFGHNLFGGTTSPGLQGIGGQTQRRPGTANGGMFGNTGANRLGGSGGMSGGIGGGMGASGMRLALPRGSMGLASPGQGMLSM